MFDLPAPCDRREEEESAPLDEVERPVVVPSSESSDDRSIQSIQ